MLLSFTFIYLFNSFIEDRFSRGFLAGVLALFPPFIWNHISKFILGFSELTFADFLSVLVYGRFSQNTLEYLFIVLGVIFWYGFLGVVFISLLKLIRERNPLFKGWFFGISVWFFSYVITYLYQVPELALISLNTSASNFIGASLHGISIGFTVSFLERRRKKRSCLKK